MIHTVTLNPALDKLLFLSEFKRNITNRLNSSDNSIGGKGTHVSINLASLGIENTAYGITHGKTGEQIIELLSSYNINVKFIHRKDSDSRTNYLLIEDTGDCCILASPGAQVRKEELDELLILLSQNVKEGDSLILSGDTSNCYDPRVYNHMLEKLSDRDIKVYLDASGSTLLECLSAKPFLIKPNEDELSQICGHDLDTEQDIISAIEGLSPYGIEIIAVSLGGDGSVVKSPEGIFRVIPPEVSVSNTIGCGDCFLSGLVFGIEMHYPIEKTLKYATAISAATAESKYSVGFSPDRANELFSNVTVNKVKDPAAS